MSTGPRPPLTFGTALAAYHFAGGRAAHNRRRRLAQQERRRRILDALRSTEAREWGPLSESLLAELGVHRTTLGRDLEAIYRAIEARTPEATCALRQMWKQRWRLKWRIPEARPH